MNTQTRFVAMGVIGFGVVALLTLSILAQQTAQSTGNNNQEQPFDTQVTHIGTAEVSTVVDTGYFPSRQPKIYWHDQDWNVDLIVPPSGSENDTYSLRVRSSSGAESTVEIPEVYGQIDKIYRTPGDKVILDAECGGTCTGFLVVDLKQAKVIDNIGAEDVTISPNGRFILYDNGYPSHGGEDPGQYHLYDTVKTPLENFCGHTLVHPRNERLDEDWRGFQVFPQKPGQVYCTNKENDDLDDDNVATNFVWSADSSKIVFADVKSGVMSLVVVAMPAGAKDLPQTSTYALIGAEDACKGIMDSVGERYCDYHAIKSLGWDGDTVTAAFLPRVNGRRVEMDLAVPLWKFVPISK